MSQVCLIVFMLVLASFHTSLSYVFKPIQGLETEGGDKDVSTPHGNVPQRRQPNLYRNPECETNSYDTFTTGQRHPCLPRIPPTGTRITQITAQRKRENRGGTPLALDNSDASKIYFPSDDLIKTRERPSESENPELLPPRPSVTHYQSVDRQNIIEGQRQQANQDANGNRDGLYQEPTVHKPSGDLIFFDGPTSNAGEKRISPFPTTGSVSTPSPLSASSETQPDCDCPVSGEFNPVCGEAGDEKERVTFRNMSELKCAARCTQTNIRLLFHSSCLQVINTLTVLKQYAKN